ncbi:MAG TPA: hypothetical protein VHM69_05645 [Rubrobacter sp.]|nr:hypothetical protein [Rubrobacter sp.]
MDHHLQGGQLHGLRQGGRADEPAQTVANRARWGDFLAFLAVPHVLDEVANFHEQICPEELA